MHVNNLIMNDPDTVTSKVTSKQTVPHKYARDILGNLSRGIRLAWYTMNHRPLTFTKGSDAFELSPENHLYS